MFADDFVDDAITSFDVYSMSQKRKCSNYPNHRRRRRSTAAVQEHQHRWFLNKGNPSICAKQRQAFTSWLLIHCFDVVLILHVDHWIRNGELILRRIDPLSHEGFGIRTGNKSTPADFIPELWRIPFDRWHILFGIETNKHFVSKITAHPDLHPIRVTRERTEWCILEHRQDSPEVDRSSSNTWTRRSDWHRSHRHGYKQWLERCNSPNTTGWFEDRIDSMEDVPFGSLRSIRMKLISTNSSRLTGGFRFEFDRSILRFDFIVRLSSLFDGNRDPVILLKRGIVLQFIVENSRIVIT